MEKEKWKEIKGFSEKYLVSNLGRIKSLKNKKERILKAMTNNYDKYQIVTLSNPGVKKRKKFLISRLVAQEFLENKDNKKEVNHKNGNTFDNAASNLEWCTRSENHLHAYRVLKRKPVGLGRTGNLCSTSVPVYQYTKHKILVRRWDAMQDAKRSGFSSEHICSCCKGRLKTHKGFIWSYNPLQ